MVGLPIRYGFVQIKNRLVVAETDLIKQGNVQFKLFPDEELVVSPHRNNKVGSLDQFLGKLPRDVCAGISALRSQLGLNPVMYRLRLGVDPGRAHNARYVRSKSDLERVLSSHTPKNIPRAHEQD